MTKKLKVEYEHKKDETSETRLKKAYEILIDKFGDDAIKRKRKIIFPYDYKKNQ